MSSSYPSVEPPVLPVEPVASGPRAQPPRVLRAILTDFARFVFVMACCAAAFILVVQPQLQHWQDEVAANALVERQARAMADEEIASLLTNISRGVEIMTPPTNDKLFTILSKGVGTAEDVVRTTTATNVAPSAAFATDLTTFQQTNAWTQEIFLQNTHATLNLCYKPILWATAGATCELKCAGVVASFTCSAAATDGIRLLPGQSVQRRFDGTSCICVDGSGVGVNYQSERVLR